MHVAGQADERGRVFVEGQYEEEINGKVGIPGKMVALEALSEEVQAKLAEELAMSRNPSPEELDMGMPESSIDSEPSFEDLASEQPNTESQIESLKEDFNDTNEMIQAGHNEYNRQIDLLVDHVAEDTHKTLGILERTVEESSSVIDRAAIEAEEVGALLKTMINKLEYEGYTPADVRTFLVRQQTVDRLFRVRSSLMAAKNEMEHLKAPVESLEQSNREVIDVLFSREEQFEYFLNEVSSVEDSATLERSEYSSSGKRDAINDVTIGVNSLLRSAESIAETSSEYSDEIQQAIRHLELIEEAIVRHNHLDTAELAGIANKLQGLAEKRGPVRRDASNLLEDVGKLRQDISKLSQ